MAAPTHPAQPSAGPDPDLRLATARDVENAVASLQAAMAIGGLAAYPVDFEGRTVTALGWQRTPTEMVPLAILLPEDEWARTRHLTDDLGPVKQWTPS
jgi:hypothetical protein